MKRIAFSFLLLTGLFLTSSGFTTTGDGDSSLKFSPVGDTRFQVTFENPGKRSMLYIKDEVGRILYDEAIGRNETYSKIFDLSTLIDGKYTIEISRGKERISKPFVVATQTYRSVNLIAD